MCDVSNPRTDGCDSWIRIRKPRTTIPKQLRSDDSICVKCRGYLDYKTCVKLCEKNKYPDCFLSTEKNCSTVDSCSNCANASLCLGFQGFPSRKKCKHWLPKVEKNPSRGQNIIDIFDKRKKVFINKNSDYGEAYIVSGKLFEKIFPKGITLKTWEEHCAYQLIIRKMDKIVRYCNLRFSGKEKTQKVNESISDTLGDDGVYSFMLEELEEGNTKNGNN